MRKPRSDSRLKTLPDEDQDRIAEWCAQDGLESAVSRCAAELELKTNRSSLSEFLTWYGLKQKFEAADDAAKAAEEMLKTVDPATSVEKLRAFGQMMFLQQAVKAENSKEFVELMFADVANRELEAKVNGFKLKYEQKERELKLAQDKFQRETCKLFLKWFEDEQAKQIVTGGGTNAQKIEALGRAMFPDWDEA